MKERDAEQRRGLKRDTETDAEITVLDLVDGARSDSDSGGELVLRPAPLTPGKPDLGAQQACRLNGVRRVWARALLGHKAEL